MRRLYLIRHAKAGDRARFDGDDLHRPLSRPGRVQAELLAAGLAAAGPSPQRLFSSPATRCVETVEPLARLLSLELEQADFLLEGGNGVAAVGELARLAPEEVVAASTHGDLIWAVVDWLAAGGVVPPGVHDAQKGSIWVLDWDGAGSEGRPARAAYLPPPVGDGAPPIA